jgi:hypothetical protein
MYMDMAYFSFRGCPFASLDTMAKTITAPTLRQQQEIEKRNGKAKRIVHPDKPTGKVMGHTYLRLNQPKGEPHGIHAKRPEISDCCQRVS